MLPTSTTYMLVVSRYSITYLSSSEPEPRWRNCPKHSEVSEIYMYMISFYLVNLKSPLQWLSSVSTIQSYSHIDSRFRWLFPYFRIIFDRKAVVVPRIRIESIQMTVTTTVLQPKLSPQATIDTIVQLNCRYTQESL